MIMNSFLSVCKTIFCGGKKHSSDRVKCFFSLFVCKMFLKLLIFFLIRFTNFDIQDLATAISQFQKNPMGCFCAFRFAIIFLTYVRSKSIQLLVLWTIRVSLLCQWNWMTVFAPNSVNNHINVVDIDPLAVLLVIGLRCHSSELSVPLFPLHLILVTSVDWSLTSRTWTWRYCFACTTATSSRWLVVRSWRVSSALTPRPCCRAGWGSRSRSCHSWMHQHHPGINMFSPVFITRMNYIKQYQTWRLNL